MGPTLPQPSSFDRTTNASPNALLRPLLGRVTAGSSKAGNAMGRKVTLVLSLDARPFGVHDCPDALVEPGADQHLARPRPVAESGGTIHGIANHCELHTLARADEPV